LGLTLFDPGAQWVFLQRTRLKGGLAKQETGHPPVISRPNDQALYNYGTNGLYRTQDFGLAYFFC